MVVAVALATMALATVASATVASLATSVAAILLVIVVSTGVETSGEASGLVMATVTPANTTPTIHISAGNADSRLRMRTSQKTPQGIFVEGQGHEPTGPYIPGHEVAGHTAPPRARRQDAVAKAEVVHPPPVGSVSAPESQVFCGGADGSTRSGRSAKLRGASVSPTTTQTDR